ncbi:hypothetical protein F4778DRAFT_748853 [Xylariomycetidae sp. FL2044]|nr:hypothetical protein F4778DRAFT_748853 [Xylariomycetidae sp. FL2044]
MTNTAGLTWKDDVKKIHEVAIPLIEKGKEIVIIGHPYGGIPGCAATENFSMADRSSKGLTGGFSHAIFLAGFAVPEAGLDLIQTFGGTLPEWIDHDELYADTKDRFTRVNEKGKEALYNDVPDELARRAFDALVTPCQLAIETPVTFVPADLTIPRTYIAVRERHGISGRAPAGVGREYSGYGAC